MSKIRQSSEDELSFHEILNVHLLLDWSQSYSEE